MKYHILSIGISQHQNKEVNLEFAAKDAADFFSLFTQNVPNIGYKKLLTDNEATLSAIQTALGNELQMQVGVDDGFVLYYSGHGALAPIDDKIFTHFLVPFDVTNDIPNSSIPADYIREIFNRLKCKSKLFFVDTCFSGGINSKSYGPIYKDIKNIKKLTEEISGKGSIVFTACQAEEISIEDKKLKNGIFTSFLISELQRNRPGDKFSVIDIFTPIAENVTGYAKTAHQLKQTPTFKGTLEEVLYLPVFKKPLLIKPEIIDTPKSQNIVEKIPMNPEIDLTSKEESDLIENMISFVARTAKSDIQSRLEFEKFSLEIGKKLLEKWEYIFKNEEGTVRGVPDAIVKLEAASYQLFILAAAVGAFGNKDQICLIAEICGNLIKTGRDKSGVIALINVPKVIVVYIEYLIALTATAISDFSKLKYFMFTRIFGLRYVSEPPTMISIYETHFTDSLGGNADKVANYIRKGLSGMKWLKKIHPRLNVTDFESLQIQANFIITIMRIHYGQRAWPDFARFDDVKMSSLIEHIKYDIDFKKSFSDLFNIKPEDLCKELIKHIKELRRIGLGAYRWNSVDVNHFFTRKELEQMEETAKKESTENN